MFKKKSSNDKIFPFVKKTDIKLSLLFVPYFLELGFEGVRHLNYHHRLDLSMNMIKTYDTTTGVFNGHENSHVLSSVTR